MAGNISIPPSRVLFIDLDIIPEKPWLAHYRRNAKRLVGSYGLRVTSIRVTPSQNKGLHIRIYLDELIPAKLAVLLQLLLSDDHARSAFNLARIQAHYAGWNKLHEAADWDHLRRHIPLTHHSSCKNKTTQGLEV
jgi:hypothetical protein